MKDKEKDKDKPDKPDKPGGLMNRRDEWPSHFG